MKMSLGLHQTIKLSLKASLRLSFGESCGDIPLYSLHKIKRFLSTSPPAIGDDLLKVLTKNLIQTNAEYKNESGNDWSCLTSNNLVAAIEMTNAAIDEAVNTINCVPSEQLVNAAALKEKLEEKAKESKDVIRSWFSERAEELDYNMNGNIPWAVVQRLRRGLAIWISGVANPFEQKIEEMIVETAEEQGVYSGDAEDAWIQMGGRIFKPKRK